MTTPWAVEWFSVGGQRRISGWSMTAVLTFSGCTKRLGTCPVCGVLVPAGGDPGELDLTRVHEKWHAANDFPDPDPGD